MTRLVAFILSALLLAACGQKGPLLLPEETPRKRAPSTHELPPATEKRS